MNYWKLGILFSLVGTSGCAFGMDATKDVLLTAIEDRNIAGVQAALDFGADPLRGIFSISQIAEAEFDEPLHDIVLELQRSILHKKQIDSAEWIAAYEKISGFANKSLLNKLNRQMPGDERHRNGEFGTKNAGEKELTGADDEGMITTLSDVIKDPFCAFALGALGFFLAYVFLKKSKTQPTNLTVN